MPATPAQQQLAPLLQQLCMEGLSSNSGWQGTSFQ
jgi:hypothetical protein